MQHSQIQLYDNYMGLGLKHKGKRGLVKTVHAQVYSQEALHVLVHVAANSYGCTCMLYLLNLFLHR